jgi:hypothetical protein
LAPQVLRAILARRVRLAWVLLVPQAALREILARLVQLVILVPLARLAPLVRQA